MLKNILPVFVFKSTYILVKYIGSRKTLSIFTDQEGAKESHRKCKTRTKVGILGLEPRTSTLSGWHSNHLNYMPIRDLCSPMTLT